MKTKIIYISGNEIFKMAQIRAAFDEVRKTLQLDENTILFGVPVDNDSTINVPEISPDSISDNANVDETIANAEQLGQDNQYQPSQMAVQEQIPESDENINTEKQDSIIPILSILSAQDETGNNTTDSDSQPKPQDTTNAEKIEITDTNQDDVKIYDLNINAELVTENTDDSADTQVQPVTIADMITDDVPEVPVEKTLEQLLESTKPLREDLHDTAESTDDDDFADIYPNSDDITDSISDDDTDATLAQLASEFVQTQDKITTNTKSESHGKIGKLKHILPFSKQKRDDSLMGGLFGWAGAAANDDDISLPDFLK